MKMLVVGDRTIMTYRQGLLITLLATAVSLAAGFGTAPFWDEKIPDLQSRRGKIMAYEGDPKHPYAEKKQKINTTPLIIYCLRFSTTPS